MLILLLFFLVSPLSTPSSYVRAHPASHNDEGCCGNIFPDSLIWTLSFFILVGILVAVSSYFLLPPPTDCSSSSDDNNNNNNKNYRPPPVINIRIDEEDIKRIAHAVVKYSNPIELSPA